MGIKTNKPMKPSLICKMNNYLIKSFHLLAFLILLCQIRKPKERLNLPNKPLLPPEDDRTKVMPNTMESKKMIFHALIRYFMN